jgi:hypothetical protein
MTLSRRSSVISVWDQGWVWAQSAYPWDAPGVGQGRSGAGQPETWGQASFLKKAGFLVAIPTRIGEAPASGSLGGDKAVPGQGLLEGAG